MSPGERRRKRRERVEGSSFMDVARQAYARHLALERWRDVEAVKDTNGLDWLAAVTEMAEFPERFPYHESWARRWREHVLPAAREPDTPGIFAAIEAAVIASLVDEEGERAARGARPLDLDPHYMAFLDQALGKLERQAADSLERPPSDVEERPGLAGASPSVGGSGGPGAPPPPTR